MPHSRRRKTRRRQRRSRRQRGGVKIGQGDFGTIFRPPLHCVDPLPNAAYATEAYVGKQQIDDDYSQEIAKVALVKALDPAGVYTVTQVHSCMLSPDQTNANYLGPEVGNRQIIYPYAGTDLHHALQIDALWDDEQFATVNVDAIFQVLRAFKRFLPHLREFNAHYCHNDLHLSNLVYDGTAVKLIDFATIQPRAAVAAYIRQQDPNAKAPQVEEEVSMTDVRRLYETLRGDVLDNFGHQAMGFFNSPFMQQEPYKKRFRYWIMASPKRMHQAESYYTALANMPLD